ncbi:hypothetical protein [Oceanobacillus sp. J11TS1]|uniref:hypothetical protein n=1 Tax=Oceanobacillus sp. J11TS1 TaxID=2807191 RepID=UPI001B0C0682|nr:hypothetical protein [Oceanobacillus sp. J11TS1]GIO22450.1 hypothetical protein J11TS1_10310 [Oceanobacillus sp. J11TS1]
MLKKIFNISYYVLIIGAVLAMLFMVITIKSERDAYDNLYHDYMQLWDDYEQIKTSYDALLDKTWHEHNRQMTEE